MAKKDESKKQQKKTEAYDKQHLRNSQKRAKAVEGMFDDATRKIASVASASGAKDEFKITPATEKRVNEAIEELTKQLVSTIEQGEKDEWLLSCQKNDALIDSLPLSPNIPAETIDQWKPRNLDALEAFQQRKIEGMKLSKRVWNITDQFKGEVEMAIDIALGDGTSAAVLSRTVRKWLNNPNALFRRVRDKHGQLRLSQNAKNYHPGRGVYRSAYRNALRLTATETNMAYRTADHLRWQQMNFVTGIEIKLSNNHNCRGIAKGQFYDICDELAGIYPKDFKFVGWHPFCRCFAVAKLADMKEFLEYQDKFVEGEDVSNYKFSGEVTQMPKQFNEWVKNNEERIKRAKSLPYFIRDNFVGGDISKGMVFATKSLTTLERAEIRHAQRTQAQIDDIKRRWEEKIINAPSSLDDVNNQLALANIEYRKVELLQNTLSDQEIVGRLAGGDKTYPGSCSSLAFAYVGNKAGLDVLDFRGGASCNFFGTASNIHQICTSVNGFWSFEYSGMGLMKMTEIGKEYYLVSSKHAAIVRQTSKGVYEYLELQHPIAIENGWKSLNSNVFAERFDSKGKQLGFLIETEKLKENKGFRKMLGYINTEESKQMKGSMGSVK